MRASQGGAVAALGLLLVVTGVATYANALRGEFVFDDGTNIVRNTGIQRFPPGEPVPKTLMRRPVVRWSFALNHAVGGLDPVVYRATNVAIHILAALLLFGIVQRSLTSELPVPWAEGRARATAFAVALVWLVHPLQTESVTYVSQRLESLMGLFYLAGLYAVLRGARSVRSRLWYGLAIAAGALGMGTKEVMLTAPVVWAVYDRYLLAGSWRDLWRERRWVYLGLLPPAALLLSAAGPTVHSADYAVGFGLWWISPLEYFSAQPGVILHYLRLAFWPARLCLDYAWPLPKTITEVVWPGIIVGLLAAATVLTLRRAVRLGVAGLAFFLILAPTSTIMPLLDPAVEHRMYLPLACVVSVVVGGVAWGLARMPGSPALRRAVGATLLVVVALGLAWRTALRNRDYREAIGMWEDVVACAPHNPRAHRNLALLVAKRGERERAIVHLRRAIALEPRFVAARQNLADELRAAGKEDEALAEYVALLELDPANPQAHNNLANLLQARGKVEEAMAHYEAAVEADPDYALAWDNYGVAKVLADDYLAAIPMFRRAIAADSTLATAHLHLGLALEAVGQSGDAVGPLREALRLDPGARGALRALVRILAAATGPAVQERAEAVRLAEELTAGGMRGSSEDLALLAMAYARAGRFGDAIRAGERALVRARESDEDDERVEIERALACFRVGRVCENDSERAGGRS